MVAHTVNLYEQAAVREALGDVLRPGGLALTDEMLAACGLAPGAPPPRAAVADVGCGAGATVSHLGQRGGLFVVGFDVSPVLLGAARGRKPNLPLALAHGACLPIADGAFDIVLSECILSALPQTDAVLAEFRRVLKPGGWLALSDLYVRGDDRMRCTRRPRSGPLTREQMAQMLDEHGFDVVIWRDRSDALKVFAARLIFAGVPLAVLGCDGGASPGYYWLVARKT